LEIIGEKKKTKPTNIQENKLLQEKYLIGQP
jgi:hypothetical protein